MPYDLEFEHMMLKSWIWKCKGVEVPLDVGIPYLRSIRNQTKWLLDGV